MSRRNSAVYLEKLIFFILLMIIISMIIPFVLAETKNSEEPEVPRYPEDEEFDPEKAENMIAEYFFEKLTQSMKNRDLSFVIVDKNGDPIDHYFFKNGELADENEDHVFNEYF